MAFLNNKYTSFDPSVSIVHEGSISPAKTVEASSSQQVIHPNAGDDGIAAVTVKPIYYSAAGYPYTREFVVRGNYFNSDYGECENLRTLIFEGDCECVFDVHACDNLSEVTFRNSTNAQWNSTFRLFSGIDNSSVLGVVFDSVSDDWLDTFDEWDCELAFNLLGVEYIIVYNGWDHNLVCYSEELHASDLESLIENFADMSSSGEERSLTIGETNISKIDAEHLAMATAKGWIIE